MPKTQIWGTDGGYIGSFSVEDIGGDELALFQASITVSGAKNFDQWWHHVLHQFHEAVEKMPKTADMTTESKDGGANG